MNQRLRTLKELKETWWWRQKNFRWAHKDKPVPGIPVDYSDASSKRIAFNYELMRRSPEGSQFKKSYLELDRETWTICSVLWSASPGAPYRFAINDAPKTERGWFAFDPKVQWNLKLNDSSLKAAFMRDINIQREIQKIHAQRHLEGKRNRGISWNYVEILDRHQNKIGTLNPSQRHMASVGRVRAVELFGEFTRRMAELNQHLKDDVFSIVADAPESYSGAYNGYT